MFDWFNKKKKVKGKYVIIHYVDIGNLTHDGVDMSDRNAILHQTSEYVEKEIAQEDAPSAVELYLQKVAKKLSIKKDYSDIADEWFVPTRGKSEVKILKFD